MVYAKKSLGQHWLKSQGAARLIVAEAGLKTDETALEIGPGTGFLTEFLLQTGAEVVAVEKDERLVRLLTEKFAGQKIKIIQGDVLETEIDLPAKYKLVANLPYYITGQILRKFLGAENQPELMVILVQDEVAKRIVAQDPSHRAGNKESILSLSVKAYGEPKYISKVPAKFFSPPPQVDSAILVIDKINKTNFSNHDEQKFFELVKRGFSEKRKMLRNHLPVSPATFSRCKIEPTSRAENLTLDQWLCLAQK